MSGGSSFEPSQTESGGASRRILVLCCGESARGDDAAAFLAAELLPALLARQGRGGEVEIRPVGQLEPNDLLDAGPADAVVVADAVRGVPAGEVVRRGLAELASGGPGPRSSHMLPLRDVLALVATLRGELPPGRFVGLGGSAFGLGDAMSAPVRDAIPSFAAAIASEIVALAGEPQRGR